jgi:hypothetical protein
MSTIEIVGSGLGAVGAILLVPKEEKPAYKVGVILIAAGFFLPVFSHYLNPVDWLGIVSISLIISVSFILSYYTYRKEQKKKTAAQKQTES